MNPMDKEAKIYVAGHQGLVGSCLMRKLRDAGYRNLVSRSHEELDLTRQRETEDFFKAEKIQYVFLAAGKVGGIHANNTYKAEFIYQNLLIASNVIHASYLSGVKKLLNLGSSCIYPKLASQPIQEEALLTGYLEPTNEPYAIAKIAAVKLCRYYNEQYGCNFISVMPTNLYGAHDHYDLEKSHVLPAFLRKFHLAKLLSTRDTGAILSDFERYGVPAGLQKNLRRDQDFLEEGLSNYGIQKDAVTLWGSGSAHREFLHVDDLADACVFLMQRHQAKDIGESINIGSGEEIQVKSLAELIREVVQYKGDIRWDLSKPDGTPRKYLDSSRIKALGWARVIGLREGLERTYQGYCRYAATEPTLVDS